MSRERDTVFRQFPRCVVWVTIALGSIEQAKSSINEVSTRNPLEVKYRIEKVKWETCATVLNGVGMKQKLITGW